MSKLVRIAALLFLFAVPAHAKEWQPSQQENMYIQAVAAGKLWKARELASLAHIDPANIAGHPLVAHLINPWWNIPRPALWSDDIFNYVFNELEQDPNAVPNGMERTVFSTFCQSMLGVTPQDTESTFRRTVERIHVALKRGARVTPYPTKNPVWRESQPLPACLGVYEMLPENSPLKSEFLQLIDLYLAKGADPNELYGNISLYVPLTVAIHHFDTGLLAVLKNHHANFQYTFNTGMKNMCGHGQKRVSPIDTLIADIAAPSDKDVPRAEPFLRAFAAAGGDIKTPIFTCEHETKTLKEMALDNGQTEYARMMMRLESNPPTAADAAKLPDDFHYGGHTAHDSDDLPHMMIAPPAVKQPAPGTGDNVTEMTRVLFGRQQAQPFTFKDILHTPSGAVGENLAITFTPTSDDACKARFKAHAHWALPLLGKQSDHDTDYVVDFTKATRFAITYQPEAFSKHGPPDSQIRNPTYVQRKVPFINVWGDNAFCILGFEDFPTHCSSANKPLSLRVDLDFKPDEQQRAFTQLKTRCQPPAVAPGNLDALSKIMFGSPKPPSAAPPAKTEEGADMLYALYGFSAFKPYTHSMTFLKPDGSRLTLLTDTYTPSLVDSCHLRVAYSRSETTEGKPFFGPRDATYLYDFTKMADINVDIIANPAQGIAHMVGGTIDDARPMVISTTAVGAGARCELGTQPPTCNAANETVTDIHDPDVTPPLLRKAYEAAKARCRRS